VKFEGTSRDRGEVSKGVTYSGRTIDVNHLQSGKRRRERWPSSKGPNYGPPRAEVKPCWAGRKPKAGAGVNDELASDSLKC
jgi:hypothetical protein